MKVKAQFRSDVPVRRLFVRQNDRQADRPSASLGCATVARLHHTRPTAGDNHVFPTASFQRLFGHETRKGARLVIEFGQGRQRLSACLIPVNRVGDTSAAEQHNRAGDPKLFQRHFRL